LWTPPFKSEKTDDEVVKGSLNLRILKRAAHKQKWDWLLSVSHIYLNRIDREGINLR
jgi:hypothetical protein